MPPAQLLQQHWHLQPLDLLLKQTHLATSNCKMRLDTLQEEPCCWAWRHTSAAAATIVDH